MVQGGQYQVLIGARVQEIYDEVCKITRFAEPSKQQSEENKTLFTAKFSRLLQQHFLLRQ
mgnify:CR=1 FL=1